MDEFVKTLGVDDDAEMVDADKLEKNIGKLRDGFLHDGIGDASNDSDLFSMELPDALVENPKTPQQWKDSKKGGYYMETQPSTVKIRPFSMPYNKKVRRFIGPKFDLIDDVARQLYDQNELYELWFQSFPLRSFARSQERIHALQSRIQELVPGYSFDTTRKSLVWREKNRTPSEDLFVMAHPFLEQYSDGGNDANILLDLERVNTVQDCLAYGTFVNYFTQTNFSKTEQPEKKIDVVYLLNQIYIRALQLLDLLTRDTTYAFYLCCIKCKLGLLELSVDIPQRETLNFNPALQLFIEARDQLSYIRDFNMSSVRIALDLTIQEIQTYIRESKDRDDNFFVFISETWSTPGTTQKTVKPKSVELVELRFV